MFKVNTLLLEHKHIHNTKLIKIGRPINNQLV